MKRMVIPRAIGTLCIFLIALGWLLQHYHPNGPDTAVVAQAVQATLTAWPTAKPPVVEIIHRVAVAHLPTPATPTPTATPVADGGTDDAGLERSIVQLINQQRQAHGLPDLRIAQELTMAARRHSQDMATQAEPQHGGSDGSSAAERILATGYPALRTSEAIRWGDASPAEVVARWMEDGLHRDMILSDQFSELGVGYVDQAHSLWQHYWTVDFGRRNVENFQAERYELPVFDSPATATPTFDRPEERELLDPVSDGCPSVSEREYTTIPMDGVDSSHADWLHGDLNLAQRGYEATSAAPRLIDLAGPTDADAPQLTNLFADRRTADFHTTYQVYDWNWSCGGDGCRGDLLAAPKVTLLGLATTPGESIYLPARNAEIYDGGYIAAVLYADATRLTLAYTRDGSVAQGYAIQLENLCVDPNLLQAYRLANGTGRDHLPALQRGDALGVAAATDLLVATRDRGNYLDPRSRKDWWR